MNISILEKIGEKKSVMSKSQRLIAEYITTNFDNAAYLTAKELGAAVGVSESTVVRFALELGYDGYPEFRSELESSRKRTLTTPQRIKLSSIRSSGDIVENVMSADIESLKSTLASLDRAELGKVVDNLIGAKRIYVLGNRSSASLAQFLYLYLELVFDNVKLIQATSGNEIFEELFRIDEADTLIAISFPRYSRRTVDAMKFARGRNATTVALTDSITSSVAENATHVLLAKNDIASVVDSLVAPMSLINVLISALCQRKRDELERTYGELEEIWDEYNTFDKRN
jgi:DNA-binding MurR/RpiR family transcriptional regulator